MNRQDSSDSVIAYSSMPQRSVIRVRVALLWLSATVVACHEPPRVEADTAMQTTPSVQPTARVPDSNRSNRSDSARAPTADTIVARPAATLPPLLQDSSLPKPSYPQLPGWLVVGLYMGEPKASGAPAPDPVITIYPFDSAWARVDRRRAFTLVLPAGPATVFSNARISKDDQFAADGTELSVRAAPPIADGKFFAGWLLPTDTAVEATPLPIHDSLAADGNLRTWTAGPVRLVLRRTSKTAAHLTGEGAGFKPADFGVVGINAATDSSMGVDSPAAFSLSDEWRVPYIGAAFRLGKAGPIVIVFRVSGYECQNYHIVAFGETATEVIDEPHYYYCQSG